MLRHKLSALALGAAALAVVLTAPVTTHAADAPAAAPAPAAQAKTLDDLLEQTRNSRNQEARENQARVAKFQAEMNQQAALLAQAKAEKAEQERRANALGAAYDVNEKKLTELTTQLTAKQGNLGEMFGVVRQVATDFSSTVHNSMITVQYPTREEFVSKLSQTKALPSIKDLEQLWFEMQREATESGNVTRFKAKVIQSDGKPEEMEITRVGPFTAVAGKKFLSYLPGDKSFAILPRQPEDFSGYAKDLSKATEGYTEAAVDPTRGVLLQLYAQRPNVWERIKRGEAVGYVIITVGVIGLICFFYQVRYLLATRSAVKRQLASLDRPTQDNPLGRVLSSFKGDAAKANEDAEVVELRISEAVLREVPSLERFQPFLRLAVAAGPLLGLIGTVIGMIITFQSITESGSSDPKLMAAGISQAMIATVLGLGIAIPLLFANAFLSSISRHIVQILDEQSTGLLAERLEGQRRA